LKNEKITYFHLGVEEEYQIIDPETRDLRSLSKIVDGEYKRTSKSRNAPVCSGSWD
jgi:gamma-glutamyl:cysteine ligase YbdK (ATP-grasp superfamily)